MVLHTSLSAPSNQEENSDKSWFLLSRKGPCGGMLIVTGQEPLSMGLSLFIQPRIDPTLFPNLMPRFPSYLVRKSCFDLIEIARIYAWKNMVENGTICFLHSYAGEWWNTDVNEVFTQSIATGGAPNISDALTINGQPGDLFPCSMTGTHKL